MEYKAGAVAKVQIEEEAANVYRARVNRLFK